MESKTFSIAVMMKEDAKVIVSELDQIDGVLNVLVHQPTRSVTVTWTSPATWDAIHQRLLALDFTPNLPHEF